jgi:hypothetical protein
LGVAPVQNIHAIIPTAPRYPQLTAAASALSVTLSQADSELSLNGYNLTVSSFITNSGALIAADNEIIRLGGNWTNTGTFTAASSTLTFTGTEGQRVNDAAGAFAYLTSENTSADGLTFSQSFNARALSVRADLLGQAAPG